MTLGVDEGVLVGALEGVWEGAGEGSLVGDTSTATARVVIFVKLVANAPGRVTAIFIICADNVPLVIAEFSAFVTLEATKIRTQD